MLGRPLKYRVAAAVALALLVGSPAMAQLDQRLTEAGQKLDSDIQGCRPINMGDYANLLREAVENKQRADKAARRGVPVDQAKVDADLANAQSLFNRANVAQVQQCIRQATQPQTQPQAQPPQTTGTLPGGQAAPAQGLTTADEQAIARQQWTIESFESALEELRTLLQQGKCGQAADLVDELDEWLDELDGSTPAVRPAGFGPPPKIPARLIEEWDRRIDELLESCPPPGQPRLDISAILDPHNSERAKFGYDPLRWNFRLAENAQTHANRLAQIGQLVHASREGRGSERENISQGLPDWSAGRHVASWLDERPYFRVGIFPDVSTTGDWYKVGHYSQVIWPTTTDIGCGLASGRGFSWFVCRYDPGGNKDGKPVGQQVEVARVSEPPAAGRRASLFDLGLYGGGAWTTDWFELGGTLGDPLLGVQPTTPPLYFLSTGSFGQTCPEPRISDVNYLDLALSFRVGDHYSFRLGTNNLLDASPPLTNSSGDAGSSSNSWAQVYDALGRYIYAGCTLDF